VCQKVPVRGELVEPLTHVRSSFDRLRTNGHEVLGLFTQALREGQDKIPELSFIVSGMIKI
jgi:hypothetical protein